MTPETKRIEDSRITLSALMGPQDANPQGNVHGGSIMRMVDEAGALAAMRHARVPVVTVAIDSMTFDEPIFVGDLVVCTAALTHVGKTSMEVRVEVNSENPLHGTSRTTNIAHIVYVALDSGGRPTQVSPLAYETPDEQMRAAQAIERQEFRRRQRGEGLR